jgi:3-phenylpropionate/cinnamic acid dioxygenase small subunit
MNAGTTDTGTALTGTAGATTSAAPELRAAVEAFVYLEARLADESRYDDWFALFDDPTHYWVPAGPADYDPATATRVSYVNDNRNRLATRVQQLGTGHRYAQTPPSPMRRVVSNLEILDVSHDDALVTAASNFVLYELSAQASNEIRIWAGRTTHTLRRLDDDFLIRRKVVELVNASRPLPTLAFLL